MSSADLSSLLFHGCGISASVPAYGYESLPLRTFPTHGGLQSPEAYVWCRDVVDISAGVYHYAPREHALSVVQLGDPSARLLAGAFGEKYVSQAQAGLVITGNYERLRWKYGERAYRFMCMDVGFLGENVYLAGEALGLAVCAVSGFAQDSIEQLVDVDGRQELALLLMTVGPAAGAE